MINFTTFKTAKDTVFALSNELMRLVNLHKTKYFNLALSGGKTAQLMFEIWRDYYANKIDWSCVRFFWVDERMLPASSSESNFGNASRIFFEPLKIPSSQIFKIGTSLSAETEAISYEREVVNAIEDTLTLCADTSQFDCTILGLGEDGHTASIFPESNNALRTNAMYLATSQPQTGQSRVTMSANAILNSHKIFMLILGEGKKNILRKMLADVSKQEPRLPASIIVKNATDVSIFTNSLKKNCALVA